MKNYFSLEISRVSVLLIGLVSLLFALESQAWAARSFNVCSRGGEDSYLKVIELSSDIIEIKECWFSKSDDQCTMLGKYYKSTLNRAQLRKTIGSTIHQGLYAAAHAGWLALGFNGLYTLGASGRSEDLVIGIAALLATLGVDVAFLKGIQDSDLSGKKSRERSSALAVVNKASTQGKERDCFYVDASTQKVTDRLREALANVSEVDENLESSSIQDLPPSKANRSPAVLEGFSNGFLGRAQPAGK